MMEIEVKKEELVTWLRSWSELPAHCERYESCEECDKQDLCATFTNESIIAKAAEAADAIEELSKLHETQKKNLSVLTDAYMKSWIPVTERLPDAGKRVLCYCRANIYEVMKMRTDGDWVYDTNHIYMHSFVTHWMPLPQPPKEE